MTAPLTITDHDDDSAVFLPIPGGGARLESAAQVYLEREALHRLRAWLDVMLGDAPSHADEHAEGRRLAALDHALTSLPSDSPDDAVIRRARAFEKFLAGGASE